MKNVLILILISLPCFISFSKADELLVCQNPPAKKIILRNDDVCAISPSEQEKKLLDYLHKENIQITIALIPAFTVDVHYQDETIRKPRLLSQAKTLNLQLTKAVQRGSVEILQHGFYHQNNRFHAGEQIPSTSSEFEALPLHEQVGRIGQGKKLLESIYGVAVSTFVPPWNSYDAQTIEALEQLDFKFLSATQLKTLNQTSIHETVGYQSIEQFEKKLQDWKQARCEHTLEDSVDIILLHSWEYYSDQGFLRFTQIIETLKELGIETIFYSDLIHAENQALQSAQQIPDSSAPKVQWAQPQAKSGRLFDTSVQ